MVLLNWNTTASRCGTFISCPEHISTSVIRLLLGLAHAGDTQLKGSLQQLQSAYTSSAITPRSDLLVICWSKRSVPKHTKRAGTLKIGQHFGCAGASRPWRDTNHGTETRHIEVSPRPKLQYHCSNSEPCGIEALSIQSTKTAQVTSLCTQYFQPSTCSAHLWREAASSVLLDLLYRYIYLNRIELVVHGGQKVVQWHETEFFPTFTSAGPVSRITNRNVAVYFRHGATRICVWRLIL